MKSICLLAVMFTVFSGFYTVKGNEVTAKGTVKYANGSVAANQLVNVSVESAACLQQHVVLTNSAGVYSDVLKCSSDITKVSISIKNCDGQLLLQVKEVPASHVVEANFSVCAVTPPVCVAKFTSTAVPVTATASFAYKFNSSSAEVAAGDHIVERIWNFGEGEPLTGNIVDPTHTYHAAGVYKVCLTIRSDKGCSSTTCAAIEIKATTCKADFSFEQVGAGIKFNSSASTGSANAPITGRTWNFGDGSAVVTGNAVDPTHKFPHAGVYTVCLSVKTNSGCENKVCKEVKVSPVAEEPVIKLVSVYPIPVHLEMNALIWSRKNNVSAEMAIFDIYGNKKWTATTNLHEGDNVVKVSPDVLNTLTAGNYFFKVTTVYGVESRQFNKL